MQSLWAKYLEYASLFFCALAQFSFSIMHLRNKIFTLERWSCSCVCQQKLSSGWQIGIKPRKACKCSYRSQSEKLIHKIIPKVFLLPFQLQKVFSVICCTTLNHMRTQVSLCWRRKPHDFKQPLDYFELCIGFPQLLVQYLSLPKWCKHPTV